MVESVEIRPLRQDDERGHFQCGDAELDRFFQHYAGQNQFKLHLAVTYVAVLRTEILGFATVAAGVIMRESLPAGKLRKRLPAYPLPVLRLARLAVDRRAQGRGIGKALLAHALRLAMEQRDHSGCLGVITDAKEPARPFYASLGFLPLQGVREGALHGEPTPMFLAMESIVQASQE